MENSPKTQVPLVQENSVSQSNKNSSLPMLLSGVVLVTAIVAGGVGYYLGSVQKSRTVLPSQEVLVTAIPESNQVACTMDAKICPDGSSVARTGPNCEFAECPIRDEQNDWRSVISIKGDYSLKIPPSWRVTTNNEDDSFLNSQDYLTNLVLSSPEGQSEGQAQFVNAISIPFPFTIKGSHYDVGTKFESGLTGLYINNSNPVNAKSITSEYLTVNGMKALAVTTVMLDKESDLTEGFAGEYLLDATTKVIYIELGNGKILEMSGTWENKYTNFEDTFDQIMQTLRLQ